MHENVGKDSLTFNMLMKHFSTFLADIVITFFWTFIMLKNTFESTGWNLEVLWLITLNLCELDMCSIN